MVSALDEHLPGVSRSRPEGGYFLWLDLQDGIDSSALLERATAAGVTFVAGRDFFPHAGGESSLRLAYSFVSCAEISDGIARLAACATSVPV
jgi:DNA-binding transcriptional MocR family regulator